jgi:streptogramin lyase
VKRFTSDEPANSTSLAAVAWHPADDVPKETRPMTARRPRIHLFIVASLTLALAGCRDGALSPDSYSMPNGEVGTQAYLDAQYEGMGSPTTPGDPLSRGLGELTDGVVPTAAAEADPEPWVGWQSQTTSITFDFHRRVRVSDVTLTLDIPPDPGASAVKIILRTAAAGKTLQLPPDASGPTTVEIEVPWTTGQFVEIELTRSEGWLFLGEVAFTGQDIVDCANRTDTDGDGLGGYGDDPGCSGIDDPYEFDEKPGDLFVSDFGPGNGPGGAIWHVSGETGQARKIVVGPPIQSPYGLEYERGALWFSDYDVKGIFRFDLETGVLELMSSGGKLGAPRGIALDRMGNVLVADLAVGTVLEVDPYTRSQRILADAGNFRDVMRAADGAIYATDSGNQGVYRVNGDGTKTLIVQSGAILNNAWMIDEDLHRQRLIVTDTATNQLIEVDPFQAVNMRAQPIATQGPAFTGIRGVAVRADGDLVVVDLAAETIYSVDRSSTPAIVSELTPDRPFEDPIDVVVVENRYEGWFPGMTGAEWWSYRVEGDRAVYDGDMSLPLAVQSSFQKRHLSRLVSSLLIDRFWTGGVIPYDAGSIQRDFPGVCLDFDDIDGDKTQDASEPCTNTVADDIGAAIAEWNAKTLLRFVPRTSEHDQWVEFIYQKGVRANAGVGRPSGGSNTTDVVLAKSRKGTIIHELGHAAGFHHEQTSPNRDDHVHVPSINLNGNDAQFNTTGIAWGQYNYRSIMHYPEDSDGKSICCQACVDFDDKNGDGKWSPREDCFDPGMDMWSDGPPDGCRYKSDVMDTSDSDGDGDVTECRSDLPHERVLKTIIPLVELPQSFRTDNPLCPEKLWCVMGQGSEISKGDVAAANALANTERVSSGGASHIEVPEDYNSLSQRWYDGFATGAREVKVGDFNGDGRSDVAAFVKGPLQAGSPGDVLVALSRPRGYGGWAPLDRDGWLEGPERWHDTFCFDGEHCVVGDVNGDGFDDIVTFVPSGAVWVALSNGTGFEPSTRWHDVMGSYGNEFALADVDGDCIDDAVAFRYFPSSYGTIMKMFVLLSDGSSFGDQPAQPPLQYATMYAEKGLLGDVDDDDDLDLMVVKPNGDVYLHASVNGSFEQTGVRWASGFCPSGADCELADMDGDHRADLVALDADASHWVQMRLKSVQHHLDRVRVGLSTGYRISDEVNYHELDCRNADGCQLGDVDGNGKADLVDWVTNGESDKDRGDGDLFVSLSTEIWTDSIGPRKPTLPTPLRSACRDREPIDPML